MLAIIEGERQRPITVIVPLEAIDRPTGILRAPELDHAHPPAPTRGLVQDLGLRHLPDRLEQVDQVVVLRRPR